MSKRDNNLLTLLVTEHLHVLSLAKPKVRTTARIRWFKKMRDDAILSIILGMADIKGTLGVEAGTKVGNILAQIRHAQDAGEIRIREEALAMAKRLTNTNNC